MSPPVATMAYMGMTPDERAAKKKRDKQRQKANKDKPLNNSAAGVVGSGISGSNSHWVKSGAKVKVTKEKLPPMRAHERLVAFRDAQGPLGDPRAGK